MHHIPAPRQRQPFAEGHGGVPYQLSPCLRLLLDAVACCRGCPWRPRVRHARAAAVSTLSCPCSPVQSQSLSASLRPGVLLECMLGGCCTSRDHFPSSFLQTTADDQLKMQLSLIKITCRIVQWCLAARGCGIDVCVHPNEALHHQVVPSAHCGVQRRPALQTQQCFAYCVCSQLN